jgi:hypothetical protein
MKLPRAKSRSSVYAVQLRKAVGNKISPHILGVFQWVSLVLSLAFNLNVSVAVTGAMAGGGLKVIMHFHVWMLLFSAVLGLIFYRIRKEGTAERSIVRLSTMTVLFSIVNIALHFVNDLVLLMKITELVTWSLYNIMFSASVYKILTVLLLPNLAKSSEIEKETLHDSRNALARC